MFLHLGNDVSVRIRDVIAIFDYDVFHTNDNKAFLKSCETHSKIIEKVQWNEKELKSVILTTDGIYLSAISAKTLGQRANRPLSEGC